MLDTVQQEESIRRKTNKKASVLLDKGAQVSIISENYMQLNHPDAEIKHNSYILNELDSMRVQWGNKADIPFNSGRVDVHHS